MNTYNPYLSLFLNGIKASLVFTEFSANIPMNNTDDHDDDRVITGKHVNMFSDEKLVMRN